MIKFMCWPNTKKGFNCGICPQKSFKTVNQLYSHYIGTHFKTEIASFIDDGACKECGKSFLRLNLHLNKSKECASNYDMESIKKEMEDAKRQKSLERMREFRKRKNEVSGEMFRDEEAAGRQRRREEEREKNPEAFRKKLAQQRKQERAEEMKTDPEAFRHKEAEGRQLRVVQERLKDPEAFRKKMAEKKKNE